MNRPFSRKLESFLWIIGFVCLAAFADATLREARAQTAAVAGIESLQDIGELDQSQWSEKRIKNHAELSNSAHEVSALGLLSIPDLGIRVAVFNGTTDRILELGAGRVPGTGLFGGDGNLAIAAHRDGFFRPLKDIDIDDSIFLRGPSGTREYRVVETMIVDPDAVTVLEPTASPAITLITCYPFYFVGTAPQRFIVRANLVTSDTGS